MVYKPTKSRLRFEAKLNENRNIHIILDSIRDNTTIERATIFRCNNGKKLFQFGAQMKTTAIYQSVGAPFRSTLGDYDEVIIDGYYCEMLKKLIDNGQTMFYVHDMDHGALLKTIYEEEGVYWSGVYLIASDKGYLYYMSLATSQPKTPYQDNKAWAVQKCLQDLKKVFKRLNRNPARRVLDALYPN